MQQFDADIGIGIKKMLKKKFTNVTWTILSVLLILWMEVVDSVRHDVFGIHRFLEKRVSFKIETQRLIFSEIKNDVHLETARYRLHSHWTMSFRM